MVWEEEKKKKLFPSEIIARLFAKGGSSEHLVNLLYGPPFFFLLFSIFILASKSQLYCFVDLVMTLKNICIN